VAQLALAFGDSERGSGESSFPVARVSLERWTTDENGGAIYVSPPCISVQELEAAVNSLRRQLDNVLAEGRQRFSRA
jgi:hypothetical protein